jgi:hypothetical protein
VLFLVEGIILSILGGAAVAIPPIATLAVEILLGWLILISGVVGLITTFWMRPAPGFWWSFLSAILGIAAGIVLLLWPLSGVLSLTPVMSAIFPSSLPMASPLRIECSIRGHVEDPATCRRIFPPRCTCATASLMEERG